MTRLWSLVAVLVLSTAVAAPAWAQAEPPKPAQIVINDSGGAVQKAMREIFYSEFERRYGIKVIATSPVDIGKLTAMVRSRNPEWTVTEIGSDNVQKVENSGLLEPLDWTVIDINNIPEHLRKRKYVFGKSVISSVIGYRSDTFRNGGPKNWADFWDVKKFPGPRSLRNLPEGNLESALLADGVAVKDLYPLDVDRAFRKMDEIRKHVSVWWTTGAQSAQVLIDKEAVMGTAFNGRFLVAARDGAPITTEWGQGLMWESGYGVPKGAPHAYWGQKFLALTAEPELQAKYAEATAYPGLNPKSIAFVDPKMQPEMPTYPANMDKQFWADAEWWYQNGEKVTERWQRWMLQ